MSVFDWLAAKVAPEWAVKRVAAQKTIELLNYTNGGASRQKKSMRGWISSVRSPKDDIESNLELLRARSRDLYMTAPLATSALKTTKTNVIGPGLRLKSRLDAEFLGLTEEQADAWEQTIEREFAIWAESKHCDALRMNDFYDLQGVAFLGQLMNGDGFTVFKAAKPTPYQPYGLRLHLIEADRVSTPSIGLGTNTEGRNPDNGNLIFSGVEVDEDGATVAYWISNQHPYTTGLEATKQREWKRVEAYGQITGRPNILHLMEAERAEQRRGVPLLAPVIEALKQITRYTEAELMASVIAGMFTVFIKTDSAGTDIPLGNMVPENNRVATGDDENYHYEMGNGAINVLKEGQSIEIADPKRPASNFDGFVNALSRYIGAALEIPQEVLQKAFNQSYSAARAAILEAWKSFRTRRQWMAKEFCQPIYEEWLSEAVASGRIRAPGFFNDPAIRRAWSKAEWSGPAPGQINPLDEAKASEKLIQLGLSTREIETIEVTGGDFDRNIKQLGREAKLMRAAGLNPEIGSTSSSGQGGGEQQNAQTNQP